MPDSSDKTINYVTDKASNPQVLLNRFEIQAELGRGGMGTVYSARDLHMEGQPRVAIKLLRDEFRRDSSAVTGLERECRRVRMLAHDAIVRVFEFYRSDEYVFITMELLKGETMDAVIKRFPQGMPFSDAWPLIKSSGDALSYAHHQSPPYVHYDFKPQNVFLTETRLIKVLDFGVARAIRTKVADNAHTRLYETAVYGFTPPYASCEMLSGIEPDPRDDVFSFACFTYELLSGTHPFDNMRATMARELCLAPKPIASLSAARNRAIAKGLAFDRVERSSSVEEFLNALQDIPKSSSSGFARFALPAAATAALAAAGSLLWWNSNHVKSTEVRSIYKSLGIEDGTIDDQRRYTRADVLNAVKTLPRRVTLGSTPKQIKAAFDLCSHYAKGCSLDMYSDETPRSTILRSFALDATAVTVRDFRKFVEVVGYRTTAEEAGFAFSLKGAVLQRVDGGSWRNAVSSAKAGEETAVVGVSFVDAQRYCAWKQKRLPTEDEWEYVARGPEQHVFPWGDDVTNALGGNQVQPLATDGPAEGIGGIYRGLSGHVWEWMDTQNEGKKVLKGGSWLETNPANVRAAVRRRQATLIPDEVRHAVQFADSMSGFRCARTVSSWPDAEFWMKGF
jgi:serine/threonine protein kinase